MPYIDKFIGAAFQAGAQKLIIATGARAAMITPGGVRTLSARPATSTQVHDLARGILPPAVAAETRDGMHAFSYASPSGSVNVEFSRNNGSARLEIRLSGNGPGMAAGAGAVVSDAAPEMATTAATAAASSAAPGSPPSPGGASIQTAAPEVAGPTGDPRTRPSGEVGVQTIRMQVTEDGTATATQPLSAAAAITSSPAAAPRVSTAPGSAAQERMNVLLRKLVDEGCSDLHLCVGNPPLFRKDGDIVPLGESPPLGAEELTDLLYSITPSRFQQEFTRTHDADFAYELAGVARFRSNIFMDRNGMGGVFRVIPSVIPTAEDLGLPEAVLRFCDLPKGLILVTGPTGSGKSTTLASMIGHINRRRTSHIITIEDPIEFVHPNLNSLVNQREVGLHTAGFKAALRAALREDPDIILVGELRDPETIATAIETAETGHLVFGTLHTNTAASAVDRMIDQFPADRQAQVRTMLAESLQGVIAQTLCKKKGGGRVAALEVLVVNAAISNLIREGKTFQLPSLMQTGRSLGMRTMNDALMELVTKNVVEPQEACAKAINVAEFKAALERNQIPA
jgi:twitching motility protein PilT